MAHAKITKRPHLSSVFTERVIYSVCKFNTLLTYSINRLIINNLNNMVTISIEYNGAGD